MTSGARYWLRSPSTAPRSPSPAFDSAHGADVLHAARERGLEGVVAKRRDSPYRPGRRSGEWVKVKNFMTQEW